MNIFPIDDKLLNSAEPIGISIEGSKPITIVDATYQIFEIGGDSVTEPESATIDGNEISAIVEFDTKGAFYVIFTATTDTGAKGVAMLTYNVK